MSNITPGKLAIYYSYPSSVNGTYTVDGAANVFKDYDLVVFGAGLEDSTHPDHQNTIDIINHPLMANTKVFGYIDSTLSLDVIQGKIDNWYNMGVAGFFMDRFGYDYNVTREKQREIVWSIHEKGDNTKRAFVNAWNPDDVFSPNVDATNNPNGLATRLGANDYYLAESFTIINGQYDDADTDNNGIKDWQDKATKMINYRTTFGTKMTAVTTYDASAFDQNKMDYAYFAAVMNNFDSFAWGEQNYSASSAQLPFRTRKSFFGNNFVGSVVINGNVYFRYCNVGITVNTNTHTVDTLIQ